MLIKKLVVILSVLICIPAKATPCSTQQLVDMEIEDLMNMTVTSSNKTLTCISQAPNTISSYSYKEIQHLGARTLSDVLTLVAGVQIQTSLNGRQKLWIRGVQSEFNNKVALYIDNVPIKDVYGGFPIDEEIPVESIEKVEIIRGPGSALYGANAFSGVINIFTFQAGKKTDRQLKNTVKLGVGENATYTAYGTVEQHFADAVAVKLEGKWFDTEGRKPDYNSKGEINTRSNAQELGYVHLSLAALEGDLLFNGFYSQFANNRVDKPVSLYENQLTNKNLRLSLSYKHTFSERLVLDMNSYYTDTQRLEHEISYNSNGSFKNNKNFTDHTILSGFYSTLGYQLFDTNKLISGIEFKYEEIPTSGYTDKNPNFINFVLNSHYQDFALTTYSVFLQDTQDIFNKQTQLTAGLRFDVLNLFKNQFSYRLGLTHAFNGGVYAKLLYGMAYRAPSFIEFTRIPIGVKLPRAETVNTLEGQIGYQNDTLHLSLTGYRNSYKHVVERSNSFNNSTQVLKAFTSTSDNSDIFGNFDHQTVIGSEFEAQLTFDKHWKGFLNASWSHARSAEAKQSLPLLANWTVATGLDWSEKIYGGDFVVNNQVVVYGQRKDWQSDLWKNGVELRYPNRSSSLTNGFATWNSSLHYKLPMANHKQALDFDLSAYNLLNKKYYTQSLTPPASDGIANFDSQYQGRQVRFSMSYSW